MGNAKWKVLGLVAITVTIIASGIELFRKNSTVTLRKKLLKLYVGKGGLLYE